MQQPEEQKDDIGDSIHNSSSQGGVQPLKAENYQEELINSEI